MEPLTARQRVEVELAELEDRIEKLSAFVQQHAQLHHLPELLQMQLGHMQQYAQILRLRLRVWRDEA